MAKDAKLSTNLDLGKEAEDPPFKQLPSSISAVCYKPDWLHPTSGSLLACKPAENGFGQEI